MKSKILLMRYKQLNLWSRISVWGSLASIIGLLLFFIWPQNQSDESIRPLTYINLNKSKILIEYFKNKPTISGIRHTGSCKNVGSKPAVKLIMKSYYVGKVNSNINKLIENDSLYQNQNYDMQKGWTIFPNDSAIFDLTIPLSIAADTIRNRKIDVEYLMGILITYEDNSGHKFKTKRIYGEHLERASILKDQKSNWILNPSKLLYSNYE